MNNKYPITTFHLDSLLSRATRKAAMGIRNPIINVSVLPNKSQTTSTLFTSEANSPADQNRAVERRERFNLEMFGVARDCCGPSLDRALAKLPISSLS